MNHEKAELEKKLDYQLSDAPHLFGVRLPMIKSAKYKKDEKNEPDWLPDLKQGKPVIARIYSAGGRKSVVGLARGKLVDWKTTDERWWGLQTTLYFVVEGVTAEVPDMVGRLWHGKYYKAAGYWFGSSHSAEIISFDMEDYPIHLEKAHI